MSQTVFNNTNRRKMKMYSRKSVLLMLRNEGMTSKWKSAYHMNTHKINNISVKYLLLYGYVIKIMPCIK